MDELLQNLIIFGFAGFKFRDGSKVVKKICTDDKTDTHQSIHITTDMYNTLKQDVIGSQMRWLSTDDIDFSMKWFLQDFDLPLSDSVEIIHGDIWQSVENLYNACMDKTKKISAVAAASSVLFFLR